MCTPVEHDASVYLTIPPPSRWGQLQCPQSCSGTLCGIRRNGARLKSACDIKIPLRAGCERNTEILFLVKSRLSSQTLRQYLQVFLAWDTQALGHQSHQARNTADGCFSDGGSQGLGYVALKTVASGAVGANDSISKGLFRELRTLQMLGECVHIVRLLDVYPEVREFGSFTWQVAETACTNEE